MSKITLPARSLLSPTPGVYFRGRTRTDSAWRIASPSGAAVDSLNWDDPDVASQINNDRPYIYACIGMLVNE